MPYFTDKNDYTPKFKVGDVVTVNGFASDRGRRVTITERKVTRTVKHCDTYYRFDDGTGAYEWSVEHTTYRRDPGNWADNIVNGMPGYTWALSVEHGTAKLWVAGPKGDARISARLQDDGRVESIGEHSVRFTMSDGSHENYWAENLGDCIVKVSNTIR